MPLLRPIPVIMSLPFPLSRLPAFPKRYMPSPSWRLVPVMVSLPSPVFIVPARNSATFGGNASDYVVIVTSIEVTRVKETTSISCYASKLNTERGRMPVPQ